MTDSSASARADSEQKNDPFRSMPFDVNWQNQKVQEWTLLIQNYTRQHLYEVMRPNRDRADLLSLAIPLPVTHQYTYNHPLDLSLFSRDDKYLRSFAGIHRLGDSFAAMDEPTESATAWWGMGAMTVSGLATKLTMAYYNTFLKVFRNMKVAVESLAQTRGRLAELTAQLATLNTEQNRLQAQAAVVTGAALALNTTVLQITQTRAAIGAAQTLLPQLLAEVATLQTTMTNSMFNLIPGAVHTAVSGLGSTATSVASTVFGAAPVVPVLTTASVVGVGAIAYFLVRAAVKRRYYRPVTIDTARDLILRNAGLMANVAMQRVMVQLQTIKSADSLNEFRRTQMLAAEQSQTLFELTKRHYENQQRTRVNADEAILNQLLEQYQRLNVKPSQLFVYIGLKMIRGDVMYEAGKTVMSAVANPEGALYHAMVQEQRNLHDQISNQRNAMSLDTQKQLESLRSEKAYVDQIVATMQTLQSKDWSEKAIMAHPWEEWAKGFRTGVTALDNIVCTLKLMTPQPSSAPAAARDAGDRGRVDPEQVAQRMVSDSTFSPEAVDRLVKAEKTVVISYTGNTFVTDAVDMWTAEEASATDMLRSSQFERASNIFQTMLNVNGWTTSDTYEFNSTQLLWLYRWMGPTCTRWLSPDEETRRTVARMKAQAAVTSDAAPATSSSYTPNKRPRTETTDTGAKMVRFSTEICRRRFAFLKAMFAHALIFPFVRPNDAIKLLSERNNSHQSLVCVANAIDQFRGRGDSLGHGYGLLVLDSQQPGCVRIVGKSADGTIVNTSVDVTQFVDLRVDERDSKLWQFNHELVVYKVVSHAFGLGVQLVANTCWKLKLGQYREAVWSQQQRNLAEFPNATEDMKETLKSYASARYLYQQSKSTALLAYLMTKSTEMENLIKQTRVRSYHGSHESAATRLSHLEKFWKAEKALGTARSSTKLEEDLSTVQRTLSTFRNYVSDTMLSTFDQTFLQTATEKDILTGADCDGLRRHTLEQINNDDNWKNMFESHGYSKCKKMAGVVILHHLCVNPFAVCVYVKPNTVSSADASDDKRTLVFRVFGDLWCLQPFIARVAQKPGLGYAVKRFDSVQAWYRDEARRQYLQDALYLDKWPPITT